MKFFSNIFRSKTGLGIDAIEGALITGLAMVALGALSPAAGQALVKNGWWKFSTFSASFFVFVVFCFVLVFILLMGWFRNREKK